MRTVSTRFRMCSAVNVRISPLVDRPTEAVDGVARRFTIQLLRSDIERSDVDDNDGGSEDHDRYLCEYPESDR